MKSFKNNRWLTDSFGSKEVLDFLENRYFLLGLALQKGTPVLILPLTIAAVGAQVYADYVLLFSLVQVIAIGSSLSLAQALIPFWYGNPEKGKLVGTLAFVMAVVQTLLLIPIGLVLYLTLTSGRNFGL